MPVRSRNAASSEAPSGAAPESTVFGRLDLHVRRRARWIQQRVERRRSLRITEHEDLLDGGAPGGLPRGVQEWPDGQQVARAGGVQLGGQLVRDVERVQGGDRASG